MLTRRENLLVRPWQQRRYHNHRKKVESALPAIDVGPPAERGHVSCKLKQIQTEGERCAQIGKDNCALVLRLAHIMRTSRVDNAWRQPPPTFLRRVGIYLDPASTETPAFPPPSPSSRTRSLPTSRPRTAATARSGRPSPASIGSTTDVGEEDDVDGSQDSEGRNLRCSACHPRTALRRQRRKEADLLAPLGALGAGTPAERGGGEVPAVPTPTTTLPPARKPRSIPGPIPIPLDQVVITYNALRLAISFPPHASVRIRSASSATRESRELRPAVARGSNINRTASTA